MSDKTRERVRAEFEAHYSKTYNKPPHLIRDSRVRNAIVSDGYTETHQLGIDLNIAYRAWQAAKERYEPKCDAVEVAARTGFRAGWCYAGNNGIEMAETFAADYASLPVQEQDE